MKKLLYLSFLFLGVFAFGQETKIIKGFVLAEGFIPDDNAKIKVGGTERETKTDIDGKFEIEVKENDVLIIETIGFDIKRIVVTEKNCYKIDLFPNTEPFYYYNDAKKVKKYNRKMQRKYNRKVKKGVYDCFD